ncbi:MAG: ABC transporter ATP-binding protein [Spirochaetales bacterium]|nr:ABC transporter ATP-binding protein [Spirochaetales bacterium]
MSVTKKDLVKVNNLSIGFTVEEQYIQAVDSVSFSLGQGESLGLVGESGCGKSVTAMSILKLLPIPPGRIEKGSIVFNGKNILSLAPKELYGIRGKEIGVIFQEPMTSLNPVKRVGEQVAEALTIHLPEMPADKVRSRILALFKEVGLPNQEDIYGMYPHSLSGGMRQRVVIAIAIACNPKLLIADEPTTALDVTIQAQIMELIESLHKQYNMALILITHNMGLVATTCDRVIVMYAGRFAEVAAVKDLFKQPLHPYTNGLLQSIPTLDTKGGKLSSIKGTVPHPSKFLPGCRFAPRCPDRFKQCDQNTPPPLKEHKKGHWVSCWLY